MRRTLGGLEIDPFAPQLHTRQFLTDALGHMRATPVGSGHWYVFWQLGQEQDTIEIVQIAELAL